MTIRPGDYDFESGFAFYGEYLFHCVPEAIDTDGGFHLKDRPKIIRQARSDLMAELRLIEIYTECLHNENQKATSASECALMSVGAAIETFRDAKSSGGKNSAGYNSIFASVKRTRKVLEAICPGLDNYANAKICKVMDDLVRSCKTPKVYNLLKSCYGSKVTDEVEGV